MREFLGASSNLSFAGAGRKQIYALIEGALRAQKYLGLSKNTKESCASIWSRSADSAKPKSPV